MMGRTRVLATYGLVAVLIAVLIGHIQLTRMRMEDTFGHTPGLLPVFHQEDKDSICERIEAVVPKAHYNWLGEIWQDAEMRWDDVQIIAHLLPYEPMDIPHNHSGAVNEGDIVCGLPKGRAITWIYSPDGSELAFSSAYS